MKQKKKKNKCFLSSTVLKVVKHFIALYELEMLSRTCVYLLDLLGHFSYTRNSFLSLLK